MYVTGIKRTVTIGFCQLVLPDLLVNMPDYKFRFYSQAPQLCLFELAIGVSENCVLTAQATGLQLCSIAPANIPLLV